MGEWIEHDGQGLPVPRGTPVEIQYRCGQRKSIAAGMQSPQNQGTILDNWLWATRLPSDFDILRYRIRRPRAMETIDRILADVPEREPA